METLRQDLTLALRMLTKRPGFTLVIVLTLALGIGANTAIFSFINALLLTPPPYRESDRLVRVMSQRGAESGKLSLLEVEDLNRHSLLFEGFATFRISQFNVTGGGPPEAITTSVNSWNLFKLLGVRPYLGETWPSSHERQRVFNIVLNYEVWQRRFGGDRNIVGQKIMLDAAPYEVLGVLPPGFDFPLDTGLYRRVPPADFDSRSIRESGVIARLKSGVTIEQAQAELDQLAREWERIYPDTNAGVWLAVTPMREHWIGGASDYLWLLFGAVSVVLMIACVNVVNLMLSAAVTREKEMAIRSALGARRARLIRQMMTESLLLTLLGGLLGFGLAAACVKLLSGLLRFDMPAWMNIGVDRRALIFTLAISIVAGALAGLVPALRASRPDLNETLKEGGKSSSSSGNLRARRLLAPAQSALALVLLIGAGLMMQSFSRLQRVEMGFDPNRLLTMKMDPPWSKYGVVEQTAPFYRRVVEEVERIPGVEAVAFNDSLPLGGQDVREGANKLTVEIEGQSRSEQERNPYVNAQIVNHGYFRAMKIPLSAGRFFDDRDRMQTERVVVISERLAERFWPGQNPLGRRIRLGRRSENYRHDGNTNEEPWHVVTGVSGNVRQRGMLSEAGLDVYLCDQQEFSPESYLAVRATVEPLMLAEAVKRAVWKVDPEQSVFDIQTMEQRVLNTIWQQRLAGVVFTLFAGLALALAAVGIYGVMSYAVSQRAREIGVRMALGARVPDVLKMVLGEGLKLTLIGVAIGLIVALVMAQLMKSLLYGVGAIDPLTFVGAPALLAATAMVACWIPARRAAKTDPMIALRAE
jgi:putative ABC transport system permease protein